MMPNIDLLGFPEYSCGFLRAGRVNGTDMNCPVSVTLSTRELFQASSICSQRHCPWLICCLQGVVIRSCFSVSWVPPQSPAQPSTVPQSPLLLQWISLMLCRAAVLPSLQWSRGRESPHPARNQGSAAPWTHRSLLPLSLAARHSRGPVGWDKAAKVLSQADRDTEGAVLRRQHHHEGSWTPTEQEVLTNKPASLSPQLVHKLSLPAGDQTLSPIPFRV